MMFVLDESQQKAAKGGCTPDDHGYYYTDSNGDTHWTRTSDCNDSCWPSGSGGYWSESDYYGGSGYDSGSGYPGSSNGDYIPTGYDCGLYTLAHMLGKTVDEIHTAHTQYLKDFYGFGDVEAFVRAKYFISPEAAQYIFDSLSSSCFVTYPNNSYFNDNPSEFSLPSEGGGKHYGSFKNGSGGNHAVIVTSYDSSTGLFHCTDYQNNGSPCEFHISDLNYLISF